MKQSVAPVSAGGHLHKLPTVHLRFSIIDILGSPKPEERTPARAVERLWREDPDYVLAMHDEVSLNRIVLPGPDGSGRHGLRAERMKELHRPLPARPRRGMTVAEIAARQGMRQETVARLLEEHGYLELSPFGRGQSRRLVTAECYAACHGHNVDPSDTRSGRLDGAAKAAPFPVFYEDRVASIVWTFGLDMIRERLASEPSKRQRLAFLLAEHTYMPDAEIADLAGCSLSGVEKGRRRKREPRGLLGAVAA